MNCSKKRKEFSRVLLAAFVLAAVFSGEADAEKVRPAALYNQAQKAYYALTNSKSKMARRDQWMNAIAKFRTVREKFPRSHEAYKAQFTVARLYHRLYFKSKNKHDLEEALLNYRKVVADFSDDQLADDALYHEGRIYLEKKDYPAAMDAFQSILQNFPEGDQAGRAKKWIKDLLPLVKKKRRHNAERSAAPVLLQKVSFSTASRPHKVTIYISGPVKVAQKRLYNPDRLYIDFLNARPAENLQEEVSVKGEILRRITVRQSGKNVSRVVLDFNPVRGLKVGVLKKNSKVVVEFRQTPKTAGIAKAVPGRTAKRGNEKPVIVIDPGHGGKDMGARRGSLLEKHINLTISKHLKKILETRYRYRVIMTRKDDTFISLDKRGEIANAKDADLFVSIHANAAKREGANGFETFYLGEASSDKARETAARENNDLVFSRADSDVRKILTDMMWMTKFNDSSKLAAAVQDHLYLDMTEKYGGITDRGIDKAMFVVLHNTKMPSILVEVGFITNAREARRLNNRKYLNRLAESIAQGIHAFLKENKSAI